MTPTQVLVLNAADAAVRAFVDELCRRLEAAPSRPQPAAAPAAVGVDGAGEGWEKGGGKGGGGDGVGWPLSAPNGGGAAGAAPAADRAPKEPEKPFSETPFELRALEVALETVCAHLEAAAGDLEAAAHPALDDLTAAVTTPNLERVRRVKTRLVRLTTRVETLREALEKILDDDSDMHDMNLTARALDAIERAQQQQQQQQLQQQQQQLSAALATAGSSQQQQQQQQQQLPLPPVEEAPQAEEARAGEAAAAAPAAPLASADAPQQQQRELSSPFSAEQQQQLLQRSSSQAQAAAAQAAAAAVAPAALVEALEEERERDDTEIAQVEQVLEPYFMQVRREWKNGEREREEEEEEEVEEEEEDAAKKKENEEKTRFPPPLFSHEKKTGKNEKLKNSTFQVDNTFNRLQTLCEYIDDTEDYINIELDNHRNQLIRLELMLTAATFAVSLVGVSSLFPASPPPQPLLISPLSFLSLYLSLSLPLSLSLSLARAR